MSFLVVLVKQKDGDSWFTWWFNHLPGPYISPKRTPMALTLSLHHACLPDLLSEQERVCLKVNNGAFWSCRESVSCSSTLKANSRPPMSTVVPQTAWNFCPKLGEQGSRAFFQTVCSVPIKYICARKEPNRHEQFCIFSRPSP